MTESSEYKVKQRELRELLERLQSKDEYVYLEEILEAFKDHKPSSCNEIGNLGNKILEAIGKFQVKMEGIDSLVLEDTITELSYEYMQRISDIKYMLYDLDVKGYLEKWAGVDLKEAIKERGNKEITKLAMCLSSLLGRALREAQRTLVGQEIDLSPTQFLASVKNTREGLVIEVIDTNCTYWSFLPTRPGVCLRKIKVVGKDRMEILQEIPLLNTEIIEVKRVRIKGFEKLKQLYELFRISVKANQGKAVDTIIGDVEEIARALRKYGLSLERKYIFRNLHGLLDRLSQISGYEELAYSPGPWVVGDKIEIAREAGYLPSWKPRITWVPIEGDPTLGLEIVKKTVEAYTDSRLVSTLMSIGIIAWASHWFKAEFGLFPLQLLQGRKGTGKTYLLELLQLLYNATWSENIPKSDFQARRELAKTTIPMIVTEANDFFRLLKSGDKGAHAAMAIIMKNTTDIDLREAGSSYYGGTYLGIRAIFMATNIELESPPFDLDKVIIYRFGKANKIDLEAVKGITPHELRMNSKARASLASIITASLPIFEEKIPILRKEWRSLTRDQLVNNYVSLGYEIWAKLYEQYGLEPFPEPSPISLQGQVEALEDQYKEIFETYIYGLIEETEKTSTPFYPFPYTDPDKEEAAMRALKKHGGVIFKAKNQEGPELIVQKSFVTRFGRYLEKEYNIPNPGTRLLIEILGLEGPTSRTIFTKTFKSVFVRSWDPVNLSLK